METTQATMAAPATSTGKQADPNNLAALEQRLLAAKEEAATLNLQASAKQTEVKARQAQFDDLARSLDGYQKCVSEAAQEQLDKAQESIGEKRQQAADAVKAVKGQIDPVIQRFADALIQKTNNRDAALAASEAAITASNNADELQLLAQAEYDAVKNLPKATDALLKELAQLLDQATKAQTQGDYIAMYFLIQEAEAVADSIKIMPASQFEAELIARRNDADQARLQAVQQRGQMERAAEAYAEARRKVDAAAGSRRSDVLKALKDLA